MKRRDSIPVVVTIAGTDPSGGAGVQADIKTISATGSYAASIITALVAQNTQTVGAVQAVDPLFVAQQWEMVFSDLAVAAVKIGMLHRTEIVDVVTTALDRNPLPYVVLDPVMVAKNGAPLVSADVIERLKHRLLPYCFLITPNIPEAEVLLGRTIDSEAAMIRAAIDLGQQSGNHVLLKGGHLTGDLARDCLYQQGQADVVWFTAARLHTKNTHGTGCTLSAAIASYLAQGFVLSEAVQNAKTYLTAAIASGAQQAIGRGHGPVDHFYFMGS